MTVKKQSSMPVDELDQAFEELKKIRDEFTSISANEDETEADARLKLIDPIIRNVLGWSVNQMKLERTEEGKRVDYILSTTVASAVIEAKRTGIAFDLPSNDTHRYVLSGPVLSAGELGKAIKQARDYAYEHGVEIAAVTNGIQWVIFLAIRTDGVPPMKGFGFVFRSLDEILEPGNFKLFVQLLSRTNLLSENFRVPFLKAEERIVAPNPVVAQRLISKIKGADSQRQRTAIAQALQPVLSELFLSHSAEKEREIIRNCFVSTKESAENDSRLERLITEVTDEISTLDTSDSSADKLTTVVESSVKSTESHTALLIGQMSAGKSTYLDRFFNLILPTELRKSVLTVRLDLDKADPDTSTFTAYLRNETLRQVKHAVFLSSEPTYERLRGAFSALYNRLRKGELKHLPEDEFWNTFGLHLLHLEQTDKDEYLRNLLSECNKNQRRLLCLIFDNIDHHNDEIQTQAFLVAKWVAGLGRVLCILPVRDTTYWRASINGPFHAQHHTKLYLRRPPISAVLANRFKYAQIQLEELASNKSIVLTSVKGLKVQIPEAKELFKVLQDLFAREHRANIVLRGLSRGSIREALRIMVDCLCSPHFGVDQVLAAYLSQGMYKLLPKDLRRFEKAAMLGSWQYYKSERNKDVINVFCNPRSIQASPLLSLRVLERLYDLRVEENRFASRGFEARERLVEYFRAMGVKPAIMEKLIIEMVVSGLIEPYDVSILSAGRPINPEEIEFVSINETSRLHRVMTRRSRTYWLSMILDLDFYDHSIFDELTELFFSRVDAFSKKRYDLVTQVENQMFALTKTYLLERDRETMSVPSDELYESQMTLGERIMPTGNRRDLDWDDLF